MTILIGTLTVSLTHRATFAGDSMVPILSKAIELYDSTKRDSYSWDQERPFSIAIPSVVTIGERTTLTPPSFFSFHQNVVCEISYVVIFKMTRKANALKSKDEMSVLHPRKTVPILYLPKSSPSDPPLTSIPRLPRGMQHSASLPGIFERVKTVALAPAHSPSGKGKFNLEQFGKCIHLSLPSPQCFTSGELIPFTLSLVFPKDPVLASLLAPTTQIHLFKRLIVRGKGGEEIVRDTCISSAELRTSKKLTEGVRVFRGFIQAGAAGGEASWQIDNIIAVKYVLRAILRPPVGLVDYIPSFRHEEVLQIMTDYWGTLGRELISVGGLPTPALGLAKSLRRDT
ncbi:hypothetical protein D9615_001685 [Tricholomella constricta]|uniref:Uncharacterized protein n=1 Tax=Tricholomella constricta TaxID=117010 RepID=A0A8H5HNU0_9AGAR|nr:hypothetical protein D9615_001685 [Tricholomella constricta]